MDAIKKDADATAHQKSSRKKEKAAKELPKERDCEAPTATTGKDAPKTKKATQKKHSVALSAKEPSSATGRPLTETHAVEHTGTAATAAQRPAKAARARRKDGGDKRKGQGISSPQEQPLSPSAVGSPGLSPDVGGSQEVHVAPEGQTAQSPVSSDNADPNAPRTFRQFAADRRKSSAAALPQILSDAELSGGLSGEIMGQGPVAVLVIPVNSAPEASRAAPASHKNVHDAADSKYSVLTDGSSVVASNSDHIDIAEKSARRRSTLVKQHSAITERALRDRRGSTMPAKSESQNNWNNKAALMLCAIAMIAGALLLVLALYRVPEILKNMACETPACVAFSSRIRESLNLSVEPCLDFARFVCGGWDKTHDLTVAEEALVTSLRGIGHKLSDLTVSAVEKQDAKLKAQLLYHSCYAVLKGERDELDNVREALLEVGVVWPHTSPDPNVLSTVLRSSLTLHWGAPFDVTLRQEVAGVLIVELEPFRNLGSIRNKYQKLSGDGQGRKAYFETLKSSFKKNDENLLDFETVNGLDEDALFSFPQEVSPDPATLDAALIFEGVDNVTSEIWREALSHHAPVESTRHIEVRTSSYEFLSKFRDLWAKYGKQSTHIFVSWFIVQNAALYANQKLQLNFYETEDKAILFQGSSCLARAFLIAHSHIFAGYGDELFTSKSRFLAYKIMVTVQRAFIRRLRLWKEFDVNVTVLRTRSGAEAILHILHPGFVPGGDVTAAADMRDSLVYNWRHVPAPATEPGPLRDVQSAIEAGQLLLLQKNDFVLMPHTFTFPFFDEGFTAALNYAGVGGIAAFAMANLFFEAYSEPTGANSSLHDALTCMSNFSADAQDELVAKLLTLRVLASKVSLEAYERHWSSNDVPVAGLVSYSPRQLYFIASCYRLCTGGSRPAVRALCNEYLQHVEEFARAFECGENSPMNPLMKCSLF